MNPEDKRPEQEAKITALLLGELPPAEAAELTAAIEADAELRRMRDRLLLTMDIVREATLPDAAAASVPPVQLRLSESRRSELLKRFRTLTLQPAARGQSWRSIVTLSAAAGLTLVLSVLSLSVGRGMKQDSYTALARKYSGTYPEMRQAERLQESVGGDYLGSAVGLADESEQLAGGLPGEPGKAPERLGKVIDGATSFSPEEAGIPTADVRAAAEAMPKQMFSAPLSKPDPVGLRSDLQAGQPISVPGIERVEDLRQRARSPRGRGEQPPSPIAEEKSLERSVQAGRGGAALGIATDAKLTASKDKKVEDNAALGAMGRGEQRAFFDAAIAAENRAAQLSDSYDFALGGAEQQIAGGEPLAFGRYFEAPNGTTTWAMGVNAGTPGLVSSNARESDVSAIDSLEASESLTRGAVVPESAAGAPLTNLYFSQAGGISAGYALTQVEELDVLERAATTAAPEPQPEVQTAEQPISTFSLNVSDVSFKLAAASLENGVMPEPSAIRSEEFINALDYRDPEPAPGTAVALAWERARYPFAHNRDLIRLSVKTAAQGREQHRPLNLVLLLDSSGSMERADRVRIIREAMRVLAAQLQPQDRVSVVSFARTPRLWVDGLSGAEASLLIERVGELVPEGGTNLEEALRLAYDTASRYFVEGGVNRVVLLTDGAANLGNVEPQSLQAQVEANRLRKIALDCFGIGWDGYNDELLEVLSRHGDGRYGFVNSTEEVSSGFADQLAGALQVAAANVKVQVEFNPARVSAYRQIGYAKHQLTEEQFRDDTVDAAEIGAAESGNALYVAQIEPQGVGPIGTVRARYQDPVTGAVHEREWALPYLGQAPALEQASATMRLAGAAAAFAEWLERSPFAGEVTCDRLLQLLEGVPEVFEPDPRPQQLREMISQGMILAGGSTN